MRRGWLEPGGGWGGREGGLGGPVAVYLLAAVSGVTL